MKKILLVLLTFSWLLMSPSTAWCRVARVTYAYAGKGDVAVLVSTKADFTKTLVSGQEVTGSMDTLHKGWVDISGLVPGTTYYFSAVVWDIKGNRSAFSPTKALTVPVFKPFKMLALPTISEDGQTISFTIKLQGVQK